MKNPFYVIGMCLTGSFILYNMKEGNVQAVFGWICCLVVELQYYLSLKKTSE